MLIVLILILSILLSFFSYAQDSESFGRSKFNPDVNLTIDFSFLKGNFLERERFNKEKGFNFNYAELLIDASIDPYFDFLSTLHFFEEGVEIDEAFIKTKKLPYRFQIKVGKFRSNFGRHNSKHAHSWSFPDPPLVYQNFFGEEGLIEKGIQISWLVFPNTHTLLGTEILQGENESSFGNREIRNVASRVKSPSLFVSFIKTSFSIGNTSLFTGVSVAVGKTRIDENGKGFFGDSTVVAGAEIAVKYPLEQDRVITFEGEYLRRQVRGTEFYCNETSCMFNPSQKNEEGFYLQLAVIITKRWSLGIRYGYLSDGSYRL